MHTVCKHTIFVQTICNVLKNSSNKRTVCFDTKLAWLNISRMYNLEAERYGLSISAGFVLLHVDEAGTQVTQLAPLLGMEPSSLTRMLNALETKNWIIRKRENLNDRREVKIYLTPEGLQARAIAKEKVIKFNQAVQNKISPQKLQTFFEVIDEVNQLIIQNEVFQEQNPLFVER